MVAWLKKGSLSYPIMRSEAQFWEGVHLLRRGGEPKRAEALLKEALAFFEDQLMHWKCFRTHLILAAREGGAAETHRQQAAALEQQWGYHQEGALLDVALGV